MTDQNLSFAAFHSLVNESFTMQVPDSPDIELVLAECAATTPNGDSPSFSLTFKAGPHAPIEQSTYLLSAAGFGPAPIFLVPLRQLPDGLEYHAVFNNSTKDESA